MISRFIAAIIVLASVSACTTFSGDNLLELPEQSGTYDQSRTISKAKDGVSDVLDSLGISEEEKTSLEKISPTGVIRSSESLNFTSVINQVVVAGADTNIAFAKNSIIVSIGALHISHSSNNVIVCGSNVDISHDGGNIEISRDGNLRSLVISKGRTEIGHAGNTLIYAIKGVKISHARNVRTFNTLDRKTSWGHINNVLVKPIFREEMAPNKSLQPTGFAGG